jgi:hypothetical protein
MSPRTIGVAILAFTFSVAAHAQWLTDMVVMSERLLSPRLLGTYEFFTNEHGQVTHIIAHGIEGSFKITRRRDAAQ